jgi:hypothetical protein
VALLPLKMNLLIFFSHPSKFCQAVFLRLSASKPVCSQTYSPWIHFPTIQKAMVLDLILAQKWKYPS